MNKKFLAFWALCSIIFLDGVGLGIIFPLLAPIFWDPHASVLAIGTPEHWRNIWYGITLSVFPLGLFFSAPMLGDLSDGYGRKKILMLAVIGVGASYVLSGLAVIWHSLVLLIFSRLLAGLFSGCQPIAQAAAMDMSTEDEKAKNLSLIFFFSSIGFIIGPILGSSLSNNHLISWFGLSTPLFAAAIFSFACCYVLRNFQETLTHTRAIDLRPLHGLYVLREIWREKSIRFLLIVLVCYQVAWGGFFQALPAFLANQYHASSHLIGYYISFLALGFGIAFMGCIDYLSRNYNKHKVLLITLTIACFCILLSFSWLKLLSMWFIAIPLGFCIATIYVLLTTIGSGMVSTTHQGWFMGSAMSISAFAWFITPIINSLLLNIWVIAPMMFSFIALVSGSIIYKLKVIKHEII